jgi:uncharacterized protein (DUF1810 family)
MLTIIGIPIGMLMVNRIPFVFSLHRGYASAVEIFGPLDAMKLRSCVTLFHRAARDEPVFSRVLDRFYGGIADEATEERL